jgi:predicted alpha/beta-fold hydrolase
LPTYVLAAADDPAVPIEPFRTATLSPSIRLHVTDHGGHLGYIAAPGSDPDVRWMEWRIVDWVMRVASGRWPVVSGQRPQVESGAWQATGRETSLH